MAVNSPSCEGPIGSDVVLSGSIRVESPQPPHAGGENHLRPTTEPFSGSPDQPHPDKPNQDAGRAPESMSSSVYDLIVIGSGPAGQRAAIYGAKLGKKSCPDRDARGSRRSLHQHRHHPLEDHARGRPSPLRIQLQIHLRDELPGEGTHHHGGTSHSACSTSSRLRLTLPRRNSPATTSRCSSETASFEDATHIRVTNSRGSVIYETKNILIATGTKPASSAKVSNQRDQHHQQ